MKIFYFDNLMGVALAKHELFQIYKIKNATILRSKF